MSRLKKDGMCKKTSHTWKNADKLIARARINRKTDLYKYKCDNCSKYHVTGIKDYNKHRLSFNEQEKPEVSRERKMINDVKAILALRSGNYSAVSAVADIIDNSKDALANKVTITFDAPKNVLESIIIADDGKGMTRRELIEALKIGSDRDYDADSDLGCFGVGLVTASTNQGKRTTVISKQNGRFATGVLDIDKVIEDRKYDIVDRKSTEEEIEIINAYVPGESGTVVIISKLDRCSYKTKSGIVGALRKHLGITFRKLIKDKEIKIVLDNRIIKPVDPINDFENTLIMDENVNLPSGLAVRIKTYFIGDKKPNTSDDNPTLIVGGSGYSVLRNGREIVRAKTLGLYNKGSALARFRGEIELSGSMDGRVKTDYQKTNIEFSEEDRDHLSGLHSAGMKAWRPALTQFKEDKNGTLDANAPVPPMYTTVKDVGFSDKPKKRKGMSANQDFLSKLQKFLKTNGEQNLFNDFKKVYLNK